MRLFSRKPRGFLTANVWLAGFEPTEVTATVTLDRHGRHDPRDIVAFFPMLVVSVMRACRNEPDLAVPYVELSSGTAEVLLGMEPGDARDLQLRDLISTPHWFDAALDEAGAIVALGIPRLTDKVGPPPHRKFNADLKVPEGKGGAPFVDIFSLNGYIAAMGTAALFEYIARTHDYETVTKPAAAAVVRILEIADELEASPIPDFDEATVLYLLADRLALEDDPRNFEFDLASLSTEPPAPGPFTRQTDDLDEPVTGVATDLSPDFPEAPVEPQQAAEDLVMRTEDIFVDIRAPSRIGVAIYQIVLDGFGIVEGHPQYGPALGASLFGYAARMAQTDATPLLAEDEETVEGCLARTDDGEIDYDRMADDKEAFGQLVLFAADFSDDLTRVLRVISISPSGWDHFTRLAVRQLQRNLRRNGLKRRHTLSPEALTGLIRLGCATRVIDEVAGEAPLPASAL